MRALSQAILAPVSLDLGLPHPHHRAAADRCAGQCTATDPQREIDQARAAHLEALFDADRGGFRHPRVPAMRREVARECRGC